MKKYILALLALCFSASIYAQTPRTITTSFHVSGICGLCETTIEKAMDVKGVVVADFNLDNNVLTVTYKPKKITEDQLHALLNEVGYDTEKSKATEEQYAKTHECCKYREQEKH